MDNMWFFCLYLKCMSVESFNVDCVAAEEHEDWLTSAHLLFLFTLTDINFVTSLTQLNYPFKVYLVFLF